MEKQVFVDFETYSEHPIKSGSFRYSQDKSTDVLCMAYSFDQEHIKLWYPGQSIPRDLINHIKNGNIVRSYNVTFEYCIFNYVCTRLFGWPKLDIKQTRCTLTDGLALALPGNLDMIGDALNLEHKKDKKGKMLINKLSKPRKPTKNKPYTRITKEIDPQLFEDLYNYCIQDVRTEIAVYKALPRHIKGKELKLFHQTLDINEKGLPIDRELVNAIMVDKKEYENKLNKEVSIITEGKLNSTNSRPQSLKWLKENDVELEGYTKDDIKKALKRDDISDSVKRFLEIRSELSRTSLKKYDFLNNALCDDLTIKNNLIFHKSTTGRFAGSGFQMQNLPRDKAENPEELITKFKNRESIEGRNIYNECASLIRNIIRAHKGHKLLVSDFSSIENRVLAWLAGEAKTLQDFKNDIDQYKVMSSSIYRVEYKDVTKDQRHLGKVLILGAGYGAGGKAFLGVCEGYGVDITEERSQELIDLYREKYSKVVSFWYGLKNAAIDAVLSKRVTQYKKIKFRVIDGFLYMRLPNGRLISYYSPVIKEVMAPWKKMVTALTHMGINTYTRKWERLNVTPGRLAENATQAVARDVLTDAMLRLEENNFNIIGCVHDEIICCEKNKSLSDMERLMIEPPTWCSDLPIKADSFESKFYKK